jgi:nitroreductase
MDLIIQAGLRAPSAGNRQPWLITVVQNLDLARQILPQTTEGNVLIVVSGVGDGRTNGPVILDCALAAQGMFLAAQALGLGARQFTNNALINRTNNLKSELGIPDDHSAVIVTRFGRLPAGVDAVSSASPRVSPEQRVVFR